MAGGELTTTLTDPISTSWWWTSVSSFPCQATVCVSYSLRQPSGTLSTLLMPLISSPPSWYLLRHFQVMVLLPVSLRKFKPAEKKSTDSVHYLPSDNNTYVSCLPPPQDHCHPFNATPHPAPHILDQQSPVFLAPGTSFMEDNFPQMGFRRWERGGLVMIQAHCIHCVLFIISVLLIITSALSHIIRH